MQPDFERERQIAQLKNTRIDCKVTQEQAAEFFDVSNKTYISWESGKVIPRKAYRYSFQWFLYNELKLRRKKDDFIQLWRILIDVWNWPELSADEENLFFGGQSTVNGGETKVRSVYIEDPELLFSKKTSIPEDFTPFELACHLSEWKSIHTSIQALLFSTPSFDEKFTELKSNFNENQAADVEDAWHKHCESKAKRVRTVIANLKYIHGILFSNIANSIIGEKSIPNLLRDLDSNNRLTFRELRSSFFSLQEDLKQTMILADHYIYEIAERLQAIRNG